MIVTRTPLSIADPFVLADVKAHARISFDDDDPGVILMARTAAREIEAHCGLALISQTVTVTFNRCGDQVRLPIGPLDTVAVTDHPVTVQTREADGSLINWPQGWFVDVGRHPVLHLSAVEGSELIVSYPAGFGADVASIPEDLQFAINDHATRLYDARGADEVVQGLSVAASRIAARHRQVRV